MPPPLPYSGTICVSPIPPPQYICILRSKRICIDLRNDGFGPEKAEIRLSAEKSHPCKWVPSEAAIAQLRGFITFDLLDKF